MKIGEKNVLKNVYKNALSFCWAYNRTKNFEDFQSEITRLRNAKQKYDEHIKKFWEDFNADDVYDCRYLRKIAVVVEHFLKTIDATNVVTKEAIDKLTKTILDYQQKEQK